MFDKQPQAFALATYFSIFVFILLPGLILTDDVGIYGFYLGFLAFLGYWISKNFKRYLMLDAPMPDRFLLYASFIAFVFVMALDSFQTFVSFSQDTIDQYLNSDSILKSKGGYEILISLISTFFVYSIFACAQKYKFDSAVLIVLYGLFVSGASRSSLLVYIICGVFIFKQSTKKLTIVLVLGFGLLLFLLFSYFRGDFSTSALGNPIFTAVGFPAINMQSIIDLNLNDNAGLYFEQLIIKPLPNFLYQIFGIEKPIFNFNASVTELITFSSISSDRPISVYTAAAPLVYYHPFFVTVSIVIFIYIIIGSFFYSIINNPPYYYYCIISLFFLHRSNLLDVISLVFSSLLTIFAYRFIHYMLRSFRLPGR